MTSRNPAPVGPPGPPGPGSPVPPVWLDADPLVVGGPDRPGQGLVGVLHRDLCHTPHRICAGQDDFMG